MNYLLKLCLDAGVDKAAELPIEKIVFQPELRKLCENNVCGKYGRNFKCPPHVGEINALIADISKFSKVVIWQNIYKLEDSFDFEGMFEGQHRHNKMTREIASKARTELGRENIIVLSAGCCDLCSECAAISGGCCRNPDEALASLESYGINVSQIERVSDLKYINGQNTVTYFSGIFYTE